MPKPRGMTAALRGTETGLQSGRPNRLIAGSGGIQARSEVEGAALAFFALHPNSPVHHLDQAARDGKAQTRAAESTGIRTVHLGEGLEDERLLIRRDADPGVG